MAAFDYNAWAKTYDATRGVSPSVLGPLLEALGEANGRSLLDTGGGTGNYSVALSEAGFRVVHCDPENHPSLRVKRMRGTAGIWEMSVTMNYRITFQLTRSIIFLRRIGTHDILRRP